MTPIQRSTRWFTLLATTVVAILVTFLPPAIYLIQSYQYLVGQLDSQAAISAVNVTALVQANPDMWKYEHVRLSELLERRLQHDEPESRRLLDLNNGVVASNSFSLAWPQVTRNYPVVDAGSTVAHLEISRSLRPLLLKTGSITSITLIIALLLFFVTRTIPEALVQKAQRRAERSDIRYRRLYSAMQEGMALFQVDYDNSGHVQQIELIDLNPACEKLLGVSRQKAIDAELSQIMDPALIDRLPEMAARVAAGTPQSLEIVLSDSYQHLSVSAFSSDSGLMALLLEDITQRKLFDDQIKQLAYFDSLTGLPNRALLMDRLQQAVDRAARELSRVAVMFLDLDNFKNINDTLGHAYGDILLKEVAHRLKQILRRSDTLARLGGDEFVVICSFEDQDVNIVRLAQHILETVGAYYNLDIHEIFTTVSVGVAVYPEDGQDVDTLLRCADLAMYAAKKEGRNAYNFFSPEMNRRAHERVQMEYDLRNALQRQEFILEYQPVIDASERRIVGLEALIRWQHPQQGRIMPDHFIELAEETGLVVQLGEWGLRTACRQLQHWRAAGIGPVWVAVNVSGRQFVQDQFSQLVSDILVETELPAESLELEVTETSLMKQIEITCKTIDSLKTLGVGISIDDFGTGYSSLSYLQRFTIDRIKIDRSFVNGLPSLSSHQAIVEAIIAMASRLDIALLAEGVETAEQLQFLLSRGCTHVQGYYFSHPLPADQVLETCKRWLHDPPQLHHAVSIQVPGAE